MTHPVVWFEVMGTNGDALRGFYGSLFAWTFKVEGPQRYGMTGPADGHGIPGGIGQAAGEYRPWGTTFYVETSDVTATLADVERLGGKILMPRTVLPEVTLGMFSDPEGHVIGLVETRPA